MAKAKDVIGYAHDKKAVMVDLKFMDFLGLWQHFTIPIAELTEAVFEEGLGFDGSSIRGWMPIHASDMLVVPDTETGIMDPFMKDPTLSLICNIVDPITKEAYSRDPRFVAQKAEKYLKGTGVGDVAYFGPEAEFFIFDGVSYDTGVNHGHYRIESREGQRRAAPPSPPTTGRPAAPGRTSATSRATRKATSPSRRSIPSRTCAPRCAG
jgi:glutamine synthetase